MENNSKNENDNLKDLNPRKYVELELKRLLNDEKIIEDFKFDVDLNFISGDKELNQQLISLFNIQILISFNEAREMYNDLKNKNFKSSVIEFWNLKKMIKELIEIKKNINKCNNMLIKFCELKKKCATLCKDLEDSISTPEDRIRLKVLLECQKTKINKKLSILEETVEIFKNYYNGV